jgi:K+-sensing histidine kinase KdpD
VEHPGGEDGTDPGPALRLVEALGAEVETVVATDVPEAILACARGRNANHPDIARGRPAWWRRLLGLRKVGLDFLPHRRNRPSEILQLRPDEVRF